MRDELVYVHLGLGEQPIPYLCGWELQRQIHRQRVNNEIPDTCLLLQHEPVFTAGKRTGPLDRPLGDAGAPVVEADRGGKITWHGPGQPERKIAAIGIRVSRGVTMHGFVLNCDCDLDWFSRFVACGIRDAGVTSLSAELGQPVGVQDVLGAVEHHLAVVLGAARWRRGAMNPAPV